MASLRNPKRRDRDVLDDCPPTKRLKLSTRACRTSNFSPAFWDDLSKIWLSPRALRELDRRNDAQYPPDRATSAGTVTSDLRRFARGGGPDLGHLRGFPEPKAPIMASNSVSASSQSRLSQSTKATTASSRTRRSSAYDDDFEQHMLDNGVYPEGYEHPDGRSTPEPTNLDSVHHSLLLARASLSPSHFSESAFRDFKRKNKTKSEGTVMRTLVPIIAGTADIPNEGHLPFTNLKSLTKEATVKAVPDFFDGAHPETIDREVSKSLSQMIIPTKHSGVPAVPNFFLEAKASKGGADVALRQACLDGAYGARAMDALRNYGESESACDGFAYTYSSTYHDGTLKLYAHHVQASASSRGRPEYHMTKIRGFDMTDSRDTFVAGATAFRNARDLAKRHRDNLIQAANAKIAVEGSVAAENVPIESRGEQTERVDCSERVQSAGWKDAHDALQRQIAGDDRQPHPEDDASKYLSEDVGSEYDTQNPSESVPGLDGDGPSTSFLSSFTSTCSDSTVRSKRHRPALSLDSSPQDRRPPKGRSRLDTR